MTARYTKEPTFSDGSPRLFVGMHRAPFEEVIATHEHEGGWLWYHQPLWRERWLQGFFDQPLYALDEDESASA